MWVTPRHAPAQPHPTWPRPLGRGVFGFLAPAVPTAPMLMDPRGPRVDDMLSPPKRCTDSHVPLHCPDAWADVVAYAYISLFISPIPMNLACEHLVVMSNLQQKKK